MKINILLVVLSVIFFSFNLSMDKIIKERRTFSYVDDATGNLLNDSFLTLIEVFNNKGYVLSEFYLKDSVTYSFTYNDNYQIREIVKYDKNGSIVKRIEAPFSNEGKLIPLKKYEPPELSCNNEYVRCLYNNEGYVSSRIIVDMFSGLIVSKKSFVYQYW